MLFCDLHVHSNSSDGTCFPDELIKIAEKSGLKAIALCDHNTVAGLEMFENAAEDTDIAAVPGVEVTSAYNGKEIHVLGLFIKKEVRGALCEYLEQINDRKIQSNIELAKTLSDAGYAVSYDEIKQIAGTAVPNRVHFARALMKRGYISSVSEAFDTILSEDGPYYRSADKLNAVDAVEFLSEIGAVPIIAHPLLNLSYEELCDFLPKAKEKGLVAVETIYPLYTDEDRKLADKLAKMFSLEISGGSDFHGSNKPDIMMGTGKNNISVPIEVFNNLRDNYSQM